MQTLARLGEEQWKFNTTLEILEMITIVGLRSHFLKYRLFALRFSFPATAGWRRCDFFDGYDFIDKSHKLST